MANSRKIYISTSLLQEIQSAADLVSFILHSFITYCPCHNHDSFEANKTHHVILFLSICVSLKEKTLGFNNHLCATITALRLWGWASRLMSSFQTSLCPAPFRITWDGMRGVCWNPASGPPALSSLFPGGRGAQQASLHTIGLQDKLVWDSSSLAT